MELPKHKRLRPKCIRLNCKHRRNLIQCANTKPDRPPHFVCPQHVYPAVDELGGEYCSRECWGEHTLKSSSV